MAAGRGRKKSLRVAEQGSHSRSDTWHASLTPCSSPSLSKPTAPPTLMAGTALTVILRARGRSRLMPCSTVCKSSKRARIQSPTPPAFSIGRVIRTTGCYCAARGRCKHDAMHGPLGKWRKVRVREDRGLRYVAWEPRPRRVGAKKGRSKVKGAKHRAEKKNASTTMPGAIERHSAGRHLSGRAGHGPRGPANGAPLTCLQRTHTVRVEGVVAR